MRSDNASGLSRRTAFAVLGSGLLAASRARAGTPDEDPWPALAEQIFNNRPLADGAAVIAIDAPYRAEDAAVVPLTLRALPRDGDPREVRKITLVIDANPSPLAATFTLGAGGHVDTIATRVRVDDYTNIHAVAELSDGKLYAATRYVKAAGGCSARRSSSAWCSGGTGGRCRWPGNAPRGTTGEHPFMIRARAHP